LAGGGRAEQGGGPPGPSRRGRGGGSPAALAGARDRDPPAAPDVAEPRGPRAARPGARPAGRRGRARARGMGDHHLPTRGNSRSGPAGGARVLAACPGSRIPDRRIAMTVELGVLIPTREAIMSDRPETGPLLTMAERAEAAGFDSVWIGDSITARPRHESRTPGR